MGRTFIEPTEQIRNMGVRLKLNVNRALIRGKKVILVDDSVVRGTTSRKIKDMILDAGAAEVHFRIAIVEEFDPVHLALGIVTVRVDLIHPQLALHSEGQRKQQQHGQTEVGHTHHG